MKPIKIDLPNTMRYCNIEIFSDLHIGSTKCDYATLKSRIEKVANDDNARCIILGDICNNSTKNSVGDTYSEMLSPMEQIKVAKNLFMPIKDKIIGITSGNHERRSYRESGIDLTEFFANELGLNHLYDYTACLLFIRLGNNKRRSKNDTRKFAYTLYMTHGDGNGGRTVGGKMNGLQRRGEIIDADILCVGHTHQPATFRTRRYICDYQNSSFHEKEQIFVNASATLDYEEYAELIGCAPSSKISPVIRLDGDFKNITVII